MRPRALSAGLTLSALTLSALTLAGCGPAAPLPNGLVVLPGSTPGAPPGQAPVERPYFHDFGTVSLGARVEHDFLLVNTDPEPVTLKRLVPSCDCTVPTVEIFDRRGRSLGLGDFTRAEGIAIVPPGGRLRIGLRVETHAVQITNADKLVQVRLHTDSKMNPWVTLEAHLIVAQALLATPARLELGVVPRSAGAVREVTVRINQALPDGSRPDQGLTGEVLAAAPLSAQVSPHPMLPGEAWLVLVDLPAGLPLGPIQAEVQLATADAAGQPGAPVRIPVLAQVGPDFAADPPRAFLAPRGDGTSASARLTLLSRLPNTPFRIERYEVQAVVPGDVALEAQPNGPLDEQGCAKSWQLSLLARWEAGARAPAGTLTVILDGPQPAQVEIPYELQRTTP